MASMNPIIRIRQAFRRIGLEEAQADDVAEALTDHSFGRRETELMFQRERAAMLQAMAEMRNQILLAIVLAAGLIIAAVGVLIAVLD